MWNLIFGDEEDSSPEDQDLDGKKLKNEEPSAKTVEAVVVTVPTHQFSPVVKHRLPSPVRQAGDGMEEVSTSKTSTPELSELKPRLSKSSSIGKIKLPLTDIVMEKLPPMADGTVRMPEHAPKTPLFKINPVQPFRSETKSFHKSKDPKFVPYEPYKAAITSMTSTKKTKKRLCKTSSVNDTENPLKPLNSSAPVNNQAKEIDRNEGSEDVVDAKVVPDEKDIEIARLKLQLAESEKQLRIQTQVNTEVKKLLVASVGEDIEAKVDYLTQDKARLAADMRHYSYQISKDFEEKEKLSVQSDVWKSKFLACSLIVDELARWKSLLIQHQDDADHYIRLLFHERNVLWNSLVDTQTVLAELRTAFDPLGIISTSSSGDNCPPVRDFEAASVLGMADFNEKLSRELRDRLLGETKIKTTKDATLKACLLDTPAEEGLREVISTMVQSPTGFSDVASVAVTGAAKSHLMKMSDKLATPTSYKCCTHCQGNIQIV